MRLWRSLQRCAPDCNPAGPKHSTCSLALFFLCMRSAPHLGSTSAFDPSIFRDPGYTEASPPLERSALYVNIAVGQ